MTLHTHIQQAGLAGPLNALAGAFTVASLNEWAPPTAALVSIVWFAIEIWDSKTGEHLRKRIKRRLVGKPAPAPRKRRRKGGTHDPTGPTS